MVPSNVAFPKHKWITYFFYLCISIVMVKTWWGKNMNLPLIRQRQHLSWCYRLCMSTHLYTWGTFVGLVMIYGLKTGGLSTPLIQAWYFVSSWCTLCFGFHIRNKNVIFLYWGKLWSRLRFRKCDEYEKLRFFMKPRCCCHVAIIKPLSVVLRSW